jgi:hypothetical protein
MQRQPVVRTKKEVIAATRVFVASYCTRLTAFPADGDPSSPWMSSSFMPALRQTKLTH